MLRPFAFTFLLIAACSVPPLTTEDLRGGKRDASAPVADAATNMKLDAAADAEVVPDSFEPRRDDASLDGVLSGIVVDSCNGKPISALVGMAGKHVCSFAGKGAFYLTGLPTGVELELASGAPGYQAFGKALVISPGRTPPIQIALERLGSSSESPCAAPEPPAPMCSCLQPGCL